MLKRAWREDEGVLTFEWIMLLTVLVIGITGGLSAVRDALNEEAHGVVGAMIQVDQSFSVSIPYSVQVGAGTNGQSCAAAGGVESWYYDGIFNPMIFQGREDGMVPGTSLTPTMPLCGGS